MLRDGGLTDAELAPDDLADDFRSGRGGRLTLLDCSAHDAARLEQELFGYEAGAVPGELGAAPGVLEAIVARRIAEAEAQSKRQQTPRVVDVTDAPARNQPPPAAQSVLRAPQQDAVQQDQPGHPDPQQGPRAVVPPDADSHALIVSSGAPGNGRGIRRCRRPDAAGDPGRDGQVEEIEPQIVPPPRQPMRAPIGPPNVPRGRRRG